MSVAYIRLRRCCRLLPWLNKDTIEVFNFSLRENNEHWNFDVRCLYPSAPLLQATALVE